MGLRARVKKYLKHISLKVEKVDTPVMYGSLLEGRTALITGGTSGIGFAIAAACARNGASVVITGRASARIASALEALRSEVDGAQVAGVILDSSSNDIALFSRALDEAERLIGSPVNVLVNNAGVIAGGNMPNTEIEGFDLTIDTNLRGAYFLSQEFGRRLHDAKRSGNILNICSSSSLRPAISPYTISKWGLRGLTLGLAKQLAPLGVTVNGLAPGPTATPMLMADGNDNLVHDGLPIGRYATPDEIANMAVVLVSDLGRMVVGDIVYMTGGGGTVTFDDMSYAYPL